MVRSVCWVVQAGGPLTGRGATRRGNHQPMAMMMRAAHGCGLGAVATHDRIPCAPRHPPKLRQLAAPQGPLPQLVDVGISSTLDAAPSLSARRRLQLSDGERQRPPRSWALYFSYRRVRYTRHWRGRILRILRLRYGNLPSDHEASGIEATGPRSSLGPNDLGADAGEAARAPHGSLSGRAFSRALSIKLPNLLDLIGDK